jgi:hypothetical protein
MLEDNTLGEVSESTRNFGSHCLVEKVWEVWDYGGKTSWQQTYDL